MGVPVETPVSWLGSLSNVIRPKRTRLVYVGMIPSEYCGNVQPLAVTLYCA